MALNPREGDERRHIPLNPTMRSARRMKTSEMGRERRARGGGGIDSNWDEATVVSEDSADGEGR